MNGTVDNIVPALEHAALHALKRASHVAIALVAYANRAHHSTTRAAIVTTTTRRPSPSRTAMATPTNEVPVGAEGGGIAAVAAPASGALGSAALGSAALGSAPGRAAHAAGDVGPRERSVRPSCRCSPTAQPTATA